MLLVEEASSLGCCSQTIRFWVAAARAAKDSSKATKDATEKKSDRGRGYGGNSFGGRRFQRCVNHYSCF
jgi:hypothetical protein